MKSRLQNIAVPFLAIIVAAGCEKLRPAPSDFFIQQINPETIRADKPTSLTITGTGMDEVDYVTFGFSEKESNRKIIEKVGKIDHINASTLEVLTPQLPGIDERVAVWVTVGHEFDESDPFALTFRPPNTFDLYGMSALMVTVGFIALMILLVFIRRGYRRIAYRRELLESQSRRLALRDERQTRHVLAEIVEEREAAQAKLDAEYLPYADDASGSDSDK